MTLSLTATGSTLVACAVSALMSATFARWFDGRPFGEVLVTWYTAHVVGMVIVATMVVVARRERQSLLGRPGNRLDFLACLGMLLATCALVFGQGTLPLLFLVLPPLLLFAFRHGFAGVVTGVAVISVTSGTATALEAGPFALLRSPSLLERTLLLQLFVGTCCLVSLPVATVLSERRRLAAKLRNSEALYRLLADYSRDLVLRMSPTATSYVSPAVTSMLGWTPEEFMRPRWDLVHPDDAAAAQGVFDRIYVEGGTETVTCRVLHKEGHYVWVEAIATRIEGGEPGAPPEIICGSRDITKRMEARAELDESRARLRAIADNLPALIAHVDAEERYTFLNAHYERLFGMRESELIGTTVRQARGEGAYATLAPRIRAAIDGQEQNFEREPDAATGMRYLQSHYVPDIAPDGTKRGFYALTFDITPLKEAERALERLARVDTLTGLGNRRQFEERLERALARSRRHRTPLVLMSLDLDKFKAINDTYGHLAGDAVLHGFAARLAACVYDVDTVARLGGDEFVVLIEDAPSPEIAERIAQKIIAAMQVPVLTEGRALQVATSIGIAYTAAVGSARALIALADKALYDAKAAGRNTYRIIVD
jgi:diguanylate cyclase (GGDEF)-like protein/PAS domain S-box-containing protein